jgi:uncharacterized protein (TIGR03545 family)
MRKKFVYFVLIPFIIISIVIYLFIDSWVESGLEYAGEKAVGAKVEIDHLRLSINPIGIEFARLQVTNPDNGWKNIFETGKVKFALNFGQLLRGKYIIETMEVNDLILGTKRTSDGSIPKPKQQTPQPLVVDSTGKPIVPPSPFAEQAKSSHGSHDSKKSVSFDIDKIKRELRIDSLLNPKNLATYRQIDSLKRQINDASVQWQTTVGEFDKSKASLADIETRVRAINISNIKDLNSANNALNNAKTALNSANDVKNSFNSQKTVLTDGVNKFNSSFKDLDELAKKDFQNVVNMAHLPDVSMKGLAEMLLGKDMMQTAFKYLGYVDMAKSKIKNSPKEPPMEKPRRLEGQNIHFSVEHSYPKFWIKKMLLSGGTDKTQDPEYFYAKGEILNITNDQHITNYPLTMDLTATKGGATTLKLNASFDRRVDPGVDNYKAILTGLRVDAMSLGQSDFLPSKVSNAIADASIIIEVPGNHFDSNTKIAFKNMTVVFDREPGSLVEHIVHDVLAPIKGFNVSLHMWRNKDKFDVAFATDLDDQLAARTKQVLGDEIAKIQTDIKNKLNAQLAAKRAEVERLYADKRDMVMLKVKEQEALVNEKFALVEVKKKEIENRIDQEKKKQTDDITKKAKDALRGLFK